MDMAERPEAGEDLEGAAEEDAQQSYGLISTRLEELVVGAPLPCLALLDCESDFTTAEPACC